MAWVWLCRKPTQEGGCIFVRDYVSAGQKQTGLSVAVDRRRWWSALRSEKHTRHIGTQRIKQTTIASHSLGSVQRHMARWTVWHEAWCRARDHTTHWLVRGIPIPWTHVTADVVSVSIQDLSKKFWMSGSCRSIPLFNWGRKNRNKKFPDCKAHTQCVHSALADCTKYSTIIRSWCVHTEEMNIFTYEGEWYGIHTVQNNGIPFPCVYNPDCYHPAWYIIYLWQENITTTTFLESRRNKTLDSQIKTIWHSEYPSSQNKILRRIHG